MEKRKTKIQETKDKYEWFFLVFHSPFPIPHSPFRTRGFTLLELLIVIGILAILVVTIVPSFLSFRRNSILNTETQEVITLVNKARLSAMSSKEDMQYGVHFETGKTVLFKGTTYIAGSSSNEEHIFNPALSLPSVSVNGGGSNVVFQKVTGATSQNATTTLLLTGTTASTTVIIRPTGVVTIY